MNILMLNVTSDLYGSSKILYYVARMLKKRGFNITLVLSYEGPLANLFRNDGFDVVIIRLGILRKRYFNFLGIFNRSIVLLMASRKLFKLCKDKKIDLIYSNTTPVIVGGIISKILNLKHIWHLHEIFEPRLSFVHKFFGLFINHTSDLVIVVSKAVYENWVDLIMSSKLVIIQNGIPLDDYNNHSSNLREELKIDSNTKLIAMIGRVNTYKGQKYYLEIASHLIKKIKNIKFLLVGDAFKGYEYLYSEIQKYIEDLDLSEYVIDLGYREDIVNILPSIDLLILPSLKPDPFPTIILEAMASSKAVIATRQGGALEQIEDGVTGKFIPFDNPLLCSEIIFDVITSKSILNFFGANAKSRVEKYFSLNDYERKINDLFDKNISV
jgi:glycosyltransferase involved in cell wall biosynthesis